MSTVANVVAISKDDSSIEVVERPFMNGAFSRMALTVDLTARTIARLFSSIKVVARMTLPVRGRTIVNFRWGVKVLMKVKSVGENP